MNNNIFGASSVGTISIGVPTILSGQGTPEVIRGTDFGTPSPGVPTFNEIPSSNVIIPFGQGTPEVIRGTDFGTPSPGVPTFKEMPISIRTGTTGGHTINEPISYNNKTLQYQYNVGSNVSINYLLDFNFHKHSHVAIRSFQSNQWSTSVHRDRIRVGTVFRSK